MGVRAPPYLCVWSGHLAAGSGRVVFCVSPGSAVARSACCRAQWPWRVLGAVGVWHILRAAGLLLWVAYSVCGQALLLGAWPSPLAGGILRTVEAWRRGAYSVRGFGFSCLYDVEDFPSFNFTRIFPPFPGACRNLAQKPLICGYNAYAVGLMFGVRGP